MCDCDPEPVCINYFLSKAMDIAMSGVQHKISFGVILVESIKGRYMIFCGKWEYEYVNIKWHIYRQCS